METRSSAVPSQPGPPASVPEYLLEDTAEDLYENAPCGYLSTAPDGTIVKCNQTLLDWLGYQRDQVVGKQRLVDLMTVGGKVYHETHYAPLLRMQGSVREIAVELECADGVRLPVLLNSVLKSDPQGNPLVTHTTVFNATDRKRYEDELVRQRERAERTATAMRALQHVTAELAGGLSIDAIAHVLVHAAVDVLGADSSTLWVVPRQGLDELDCIASTGASDEVVADLQTQVPDIDSVLHGDLVVEATAADDTGITVTAPLTAGERPLGAIAFHFPPGQDRLEPEQLEVLRTLGRQAGQALERARLHDTVVQQGRRSQFLLDAATVMAGATDLDETLDRFASIAVPSFADLCYIDVLDEAGQLVRVAARHTDPAKQPLVDEMRHAYPPVAHGPAGLAVADRQSYSMHQMDDEFIRRMAYDDHHLELLRTLEFTSFISVPLIAGERVLGSVSLISAGSDRHFGDDDVALAEALAEQVSLVVAKAQVYEREHETSHTLQSSLLPRDLPDVPGLAIAVRYLPGTRDVEVGGDFYDVIPLPSGELAVVVGDVAGHDVTAAASMGRLRSAARALVGDVAGPAALVRKLQETWEILDFDRMATAVFAFLRPETGQLRITTAGHPAPLFVRGEEAWFATMDPAPPLGIPLLLTDDEWLGELPVGATMVLYTDGLVENRELPIEDGLQRLAAAVLDARTDDPDRLCDHILQIVAGDDRSDDVALLAITNRG